jgi:hypothetical protein
MRGGRGEGNSGAGPVKQPPLSTLGLTHRSAIVSDSFDTDCIMEAMQMRPESSWSATCSS